MVIQLSTPLNSVFILFVILVYKKWPFKTQNTIVLKKLELKIVPLNQDIQPFSAGCLVSTPANYACSNNPDALVNAIVK